MQLSYGGSEKKATVQKKRAIKTLEMDDTVKGTPQRSLVLVRPGNLWRLDDVASTKSRERVKRKQ